MFTIVQKGFPIGLDFEEVAKGVNSTHIPVYEQHKILLWIRFLVVVPAWSFISLE